MTDWSLHFHAIILISPLLWKDIGSQYFSGFGITAPRNVVVQTGLCVHIPCSFKLPSISTISRHVRGIWFRGNFLSSQTVAGKSSFELPNKRDRFFLTGDLLRGDCSLMINNAREQDTDYYSFRIEDGSSVIPFHDFRTLLRVIELSDKPEISPAGRIIVGQEITLSCTSPGICSGLPPSFTWEGKVEMKSEKIYVINNEDGTTIHRSNITFVPSAEDNQLSLTCKVTFESNVTTSSTISLNVEGDLQKVIPMPVCRSIDSGIIAAIAVGNVVILILIFVGTYYFLKRNMEKQSIGKESQSQSQGRESNYQNLNGQESDVYYSLRMH
ncbi:sialic acid-binding Ig-like lectin 9 isoform X1 [Dendrobates tinctorius]|uniref:sialic acid-binding Ig-like lectin 9 isoform X1 n=1 Tax=Dendrobates tinctorius TaxID=92724 RepID=UPI003CC9F7E0